MYKLATCYHIQDAYLGQRLPTCLDVQQNQKMKKQTNKETNKMMAPCLLFCPNNHTKETTTREISWMQVHRTEL